MATKYFALLTNIGAAKLAKATALGTKVEITQLAVGDGNGVLPTPNPAQTALVHELRRAPLNMLTVDPANASQIIAEQVIPEDVGGWWIREIGLFDKDGDMVAIANCAETYKPQLQEGSGRVQVIRVILIVSSTEAVTLKIDPAVVLATRQYVDQIVSGMLKKSENGADIPDKQKFLQNIGLFNIVNPTSPNQTVLYTPDMKKCLVIREDGTWGARVVNNGQVIALPVSAGGTGATTAEDAQKNLGIDVLLEGKQPLNNVLTAFAGLVMQQNTLPYFTSDKQAAVTAISEFMRVMLGKEDPASIAAYLGMGSGAPMIGSPFAWPLAQMPSDVFDDMKNMVFLKVNGAPFDKNKYSKLGVTYPSGVLPDMRGEFVRGWDDGRGIDAGRGLLSAQGHAYQSHSHRLLMSAGSAGSGNVIGIDSSLNGTLTYNINQPGGGQIQAIENAGGTETRPRNIAFNYIVRAA
ncbi:phage tail protein [Enterobacter sp. BT855]|uniref:phage tail-collar fiber domain-containing protein n=1 Tax=unclassified Enterobacter TaxID=2608935 RepID=UPI00214769A5|nr:MULTISPECIES: phage tail protein [unclassified Enterobacter]MCR1314614.1 phage tail protein [Enterobacter sp. BT855]MCR1335352.1 phage tail protein [Enterobacter sp. BT4]MCR1336748.1 phage tail protein [Enterobacter sp. BT223]